MTKAHLYMINIKSADATVAVDDFIKAQTKITLAVKRGIKKALQEEGLSKEFAFADKKVSNLSRCFQVYATPRAAKVLKKSVPGITKVEPRIFSGGARASRNL